ncbi:hypothetical protein EZV62_022884 [Acer yangbiense]|uniref:C-JID domain-containing protein n=1 Tax=Acer yangbiense TaxID=1000413 RepID=A0A5C7GZZ7_9ROSI|nr:hypothetical protein EZV62_022884 [Acer yangbiense]
MQGTKAVESISLNLSQISELYLSPDAFTRMPRLKLLKFYFSCSYNLSEVMNKVKICEGLELLPDQLRYLCWSGYPLESLPLKFNPVHLVELEMPKSKVQQLWKDTKFLGKLRRIDLRECRQLTEVPDLSQAENLESMQLGWCSSLTKFPKISSNVNQLCLHGTAIEKVPYSAIKRLSKIVSLDISYNTRLRNLPSMRHLASLETLVLKGCSKITKFPDVSGAITYLYLSGTAIEEVPYSAIKCLRKIVLLDISSNTKLRNLPNMSHLTFLKTLRLYGCSNITEFPDISGQITSLCLSETGIEEVPSFVERLTNLHTLTLKHCKRLKKVSSGIFQLKLGGGYLDLSGCSKLENFPQVLETEGMLPSSIELLTGIRELSMRYCKNLESLPNSLCNLTNLSKLDLSGCPGVAKMLENVLLSSPSGLCSLKSLDLSECNMIVLPNALSCLSSLDFLSLTGNDFESLSLELFTSLTRLDISYCKRLRYLHDFPLPLRLNVLVASNCTSLETLPDTNAVSAKNCFYYYHNCFKLEERARINMQAAARLRSQLMCSEFGRSFHEERIIIKLPTTDKWFECGRDSFCFPGNEIPKWLIYQNQGSSTKIYLPPHSYSNKFVGFVVCIVASCESSNHIGLSYVKCKCKIKDPDCDWQDLTFRFPFTVIEHPKSDHVFIKSIMPDSVFVDRKANGKCFNMTNSRLNTKNSFWKKARFRFSTSDACCKVKKCGINLLYSEWEDQVFETVMMAPQRKKKKIAT